MEENNQNENNQNENSQNENSQYKKTDNPQTEYLPDINSEDSDDKDCFNQSDDAKSDTRTNMDDTNSGYYYGQTEHTAYPQDQPAENTQSDTYGSNQTQPNGSIPYSQPYGSNDQTPPNGNTSYGSYDYGTNTEPSYENTAYNQYGTNSQGQPDGNTPYHAYEKNQGPPNNNGSYTQYDSRQGQPNDSAAYGPYGSGQEPYSDNAAYGQYGGSQGAYNGSSAYGSYGSGQGPYSDNTAYGQYQSEQQPSNGSSPYGSYGGGQRQSNGSPYSQYQSGPHPPHTGYQKTDGSNPGNGFGIASMILGIISLAMFCTCLNIPIAAAAIIFGILQLMKGSHKPGSGPAIAGLIMAALSILALIVTIFLMWTPIQSLYEEELKNRPDSSYDRDFDLDNGNDLEDWLERYRDYHY